MSPQLLGRPVVVPLGGRLFARCQSAFLDHEAVQGGEDQAEDPHHGERPSPAGRLGHGAADGDAEHGAEGAAGDEGAGEGGPQGDREDAEDHGDPDAAVRGLADADEEAAEEHLPVVRRQGAPEGGHAPQRGGEQQTAHSAPPVGHEGHGEGEHADGQGHDAAERPQGGVGQQPFGFEQWEDGVEDLAGHVVGQQQAEAEGEDRPGIGLGDGPGRRGRGQGLRSGVKLHCHHLDCLGKGQVRRVCRRRSRRVPSCGRRASSPGRRSAGWSGCPRWPRCWGSTASAPGTRGSRPG